jgi:hypothetical protein
MTVSTSDATPRRSPAARKKRRYSDGHPLDHVQYVESKLILKGDRFTSVDSFDEFARLVKRTAKQADVDFSRKAYKDVKPRIREVLFFDTHDFRLYNNAFILRKRTEYVDGFAVGDPEIVFKFRHPDLQRTADMDVRPQIAGDYRIKFKAEALPLKGQVGGVRTLYSHNAQFPLSHVHAADRDALSTLIRLLPPLRTIKTTGNEKVELVNHTAVEEVLLDVGMLDFGKGVTAKANVAVWRNRGDQRQLVGEFAYQCKFERLDERHAVAMKRAEQFLIQLQETAQDWLALGTTKTGTVYRLKGNPPTAHE